VIPIPPWVVVAAVGGAISATTGFFARVMLKKHTHLEAKVSSLQGQVNDLRTQVPPTQA